MNSCSLKTVRSFSSFFDLSDPAADIALHVQVLKSLQIHWIPWPTHH